VIDEQPNESGSGTAGGDDGVDAPQSPTGLILHSACGSQYCSHDFKKLLEKNGIRKSMSRKETTTAIF